MIMKVFVTGGTGYIGSHVARASRRHGHQTYALIRDPRKAPNLERFEIIPVIGNLDAPESFQQILATSDAVIHCAMEWTERGPELDHLAIRTILETSNKIGNPHILIYTSGVWIYGSTGPNIVDEDSPIHPLPITKHRVEHEKIVLNAASDCLKTVVVRPGCVYGERGGLTAIWFESAAKGVVEIPGDGHNHWAMVHAEDLAEGYVLAMENKLTSKIINYTDDSHSTVLDMATAAATAATGIPGKVHFLDSAQAEKRFGKMLPGLLVDQWVKSEFARRSLGWRPYHQSFIEDAEVYYRAWKASKMNP